MQNMDHVTRKLDLLHANNKGTDQTANPHSLVSAIVIRHIESGKMETHFMQNYNILASLCS